MLRIGHVVPWDGPLPTPSGQIKKSQEKDDFVFVGFPTQFLDSQFVCFSQSQKRLSECDIYKTIRGESK